MNFGTYNEKLGYDTVDEHEMKHSATFMLYWGLATFTVGLMPDMFWLLPYMIGLFSFNFFIGLFVGLKYAPSMFLGKLFNKAKPLPIGAVQKQFAWSLGFTISLVSFTLSLFLQSNDSNVYLMLCSLCIFCNTMLYFEAIFNFCVGCQIYKVFKKVGLIQNEEVQPRCMNNSCEA